MEFDKEKYLKRYNFGSHTRGIVLGILVTIFYYEVVAYCAC